MSQNLYQLLDAPVTGGRAGKRAEHLQAVGAYGVLLFYKAESLWVGIFLVMSMS